MFMYSWEDREKGLLQPILYSRFTGRDRGRSSVGTNEDQGPGDSWQWCLATSHMAFSLPPLPYKETRIVSSKHLTKPKEKKT